MVRSARSAVFSRSQWVQQAVVLIHAQLHVAQDFAQQGPDDDLGTVIRNHHDPTRSITKRVMASFSPNPMEARCLGHLVQLAIRHQAQLRQTVTSTRQVPTKSGRGSSGSQVLR